MPVRENSSLLFSSCHLELFISDDSQVFALAKNHLFNNRVTPETKCKVSSSTG